MGSVSERRHPSIDALHYLIKSISELSEAEINYQRLDALYEEGHRLILLDNSGIIQYLKIIKKRLLNGTKSNNENRFFCR